MVQDETTTCYTFEVKMLIQILAKDEEAAREKLDKDGGYVTKRDVDLKDSISLYSGLN
jgi:hypothetical protein